jgi:hypothetical protein
MDSGAVNYRTRSANARTSATARSHETNGKGVDVRYLKAALAAIPTAI